MSRKPAAHRAYARGWNIVASLRGRSYAKRLGSIGRAVWSDFEAWPELVTEGVNGMGFGDAAGLAKLLVDVLSDDEKMGKLREGATRETERRWDGEWDNVAGRVLKIGGAR